MSFKVCAENFKPTENGKGDRHNSDDDEHPSPRGQRASAMERSKKPGLDPPAGHVAKVAEAAEYRGPGPELGLLVPGAVDEVRTYTTRQGDVLAHVPTHKPTCISFSINIDPHLICRYSFTKPHPVISDIIAIKPTIYHLY